MKRIGLPNWDRLVARTALVLMIGGAALALFALAWESEAPGWVTMAAVSGVLFGALKVATLNGCVSGTPMRRLAVYLILWPGLNARAFLSGNLKGTVAVSGREWVAAMAKTALGIALVGGAAAHVCRLPAMAAGWIGMAGVVFVLHFGVMHVASCALRRCGFIAPPIMHAPMRAVSLTEFWSKRWNVAFAEVARRFVFRPLARRCGAMGAGGVVFLVSGLVHEAAISLPARGGWGGPTFYFLLNALGVALERSRAGVALGLGSGRRGRLWVLGFTVIPLPWLFHAPFVERVIIPLLKDLSFLIP